MKKINPDTFGMLGEMTSMGNVPASRIESTKKKKGPPTKKRFIPRLNEGAQQELFDCQAKFILAWSEKGSGKTWGAVEKLLAHCIAYTGALAGIFVAVKSMANKGGAWDNLFDMLATRKLADPEFFYSDISTDAQGNEQVFVACENGGISQIILVSSPYGSQIKNRIPGYALSFAVVDELDKTDGDEYLKAVAAQIGRRAGIPGEAQQYVACCNPLGPSSWIYKTWFEENVFENGEEDPNFANIYFPADQNRKNMPKGYFEALASLYRNDAVARARMIEGQWVDKPSGESIFGLLYDVNQHVSPLDDTGKPHPKLRLSPDPDRAILIGIDSGSTHHSFSILQRRPVKGIPKSKMKWVVIDEVVIIKKKLTYKKIIRPLMRRVQFWFRLSGCSKIVAISDSSALNVWRPAGKGSFDAMDMEGEWNSLNEEMGLPRLKIIGADKFDGSVDARIDILSNALGDDEIVVSSGCPKHQQMLLMLESEKNTDGESGNKTKIRRSRHLHVFDSLTYVMQTGVLSPHKLIAQSGGSQMLITVRS